MINQQKFSRRLKEAREKCNMRQNALAESVGIAPQTLSAYETGKKMPTLDNAVELAGKLGVSLDWLLGIDRPQEKGAPATLADIACDLLNWQTDRVVDDMEVGTRRVEGYDTAYDTEVAYICISNEHLVGFISRREKVVALLNDGTIDRDFYDSWIEGELARLQKIPFSPFFELDDGELPF